MKDTLPIAVAAGATVALIGLAGCFGGTTRTTPETPRRIDGALANLDTCTILTPAQLEAGAFRIEERVEQLDWEPGCSYSGETVSLSLFKNQEETVRSYEENGNWMDYESVQINDRRGARAQAPGDTADSCSTLVSAGGGVILVDVQSADPRKPIDGCAESLKIAQQIEPNLPE